MLILAAHPDDCVILAGEYGLEARQAGRSVQIVYLTCGVRGSDAARAERRQLEAIEAWGSAGVSAQCLQLLDLPPSDVEGPRRYGSDDVARAVDRVAQAVESLPANSVVFLPADGESHVDHVTIREVGLQALARVGREDILVMEAPEYNTYYSLLRSPAKTLLYVVKQFPLLGRLASRLGLGPGRSGFTHGGPGWVLPPSDARLEKKKDMLRRFRSEDGDLLVHYFGHPDRFRRVQDVEAALSRRPTLRLQIGGRRLAPSVVFLWAAIWGGVFSAAFALAAWCARAIPGPPCVGWFIAALGFVALGLAARHRKHFERFLIYLLSGIGLVWGSIHGIALGISSSVRWFSTGL
jgi:LmbE family N-acetylglucosaminyl deacetylase